MPRTGRMADMRKQPRLWAGLLVLGALLCGGPSRVAAEAETRSAGSEPNSTAGTRVGVADPATNSAPQSDGTQRVLPVDFKYLGAFRLPGGGDRPATFAYGGNAGTRAGWTASRPASSAPLWISKTLGTRLHDGRGRFSGATTTGNRTIPVKEQVINPGYL